MPIFPVLKRWKQEEQDSKIISSASQVWGQHGLYKALTLNAISVHSYHLNIKNTTVILLRWGKESSKVEGSLGCQISHEILL